MDLSKSGGPAFPSFIQWGPEGGLGFEGEPAGEEGEFTYYSGVTTRDWLAATMDCEFNIHEPQLAEEIAGRPMPDSFIEQVQWAFEVEAKLRYMKADAMLKVREM
jgi:hypothetical protein